MEEGGCAKQSSKAGRAEIWARQQKILLLVLFRGMLDACFPVGPTGGCTFDDIQSPVVLGHLADYEHTGFRTLLTDFGAKRKKK